MFRLFNDFLAARHIFGVLKTDLAKICDLSDFETLLKIKLNQWSISLILIGFNSNQSEFSFYKYISENKVHLYY